MDWAERVAQLSHARRLKIGALIVKDNHVHYGYNGMPEGWDNNCENLIGYDKGEPVLKTKPEVLHAESNAIAKLAKSNESAAGADLFVTHSPCLDCAKLILQSGIRRVWFKNHYRDSYGVEFLKQSGIQVHEYDNSQV